MRRALGIVTNPMSPLGTYGVHVAEKGLLDAIVQYGSWDQYVIWSEWYESQTSARHVSVRREPPLDNTLQSLSTLHHVGLGPARLDRLRGKEPLPATTSVFAALSYQSQLADHLLQYTVRKTEGDVSVLVSQAAARVVENIYLQFAEHGLESVSGGGPTLTVIPIGVDLDRFHPATPEEKTLLRQKHDLPQHLPIAIVISRFSPSDKMDLLPLIQGVARRSGVDPFPGLLLLTGGDQYFGASDYARILSDEIQESGLGGIVSCRVENTSSHLVELLRASDVFVSLADSVQETFGITPVEAMACGVPCIVSDWDGYRETVLDGETGLLVPTSWVDADPIWRVVEATSSDYRDLHILLGQSVSIDVEAAVNGIYRLLNSPLQRSTYGSAARRRAEGVYRWPGIVQQYEEVWQEALGRSRFRAKTGLDSHIDYARVFCRYPTQMMTDDSVLRITDWGRTILSGVEPAVILEDVRALISSADIAGVLGSLADNALPLHEIAARLPAVSPARVRLVVAWLTKYGLLAPAIFSPSPARCADV